MTWSITEGVPNYLVLFSMLGWVRDASHFIGGPMLLTFASKLRSRRSLRLFPKELGTPWPERSVRVQNRTCISINGKHFYISILDSEHSWFEILKTSVFRPLMHKSRRRSLSPTCTPQLPQLTSRNLLRNRRTNIQSKVRGQDDTNGSLQVNGA